VTGGALSLFVGERLIRTFSTGLLVAPPVAARAFLVFVAAGALAWVVTLPLAALLAAAVRLSLTNCPRAMSLPAVRIAAASTPNVERD
jgi:hypothetical protein